MSELRGLFEESHGGLRRLALLLYAMVLPPFLLITGFTATPERRFWALGGVGLVCLWSVGLLLAKKKPQTPDWVLVAAVVPTLSCGMAYVGGDFGAPVFLAVMTAPLAWCGVLLGRWVVFTAWAVGTLLCFGVSLAQGGLGFALGSAALFATVEGLVGWVTFGKSWRHRTSRLRSLDRQFNDIELVTQWDGTVVDANDRAVTAYGHPKAALLGCNLETLALEAPNRARLSSLRSLVMETQHRRHDGTCFPVEVSSRVFISDGVEHVHHLIRDISARKQADQERRFLSALVTHMQEAVITTSLEGVVEGWSPGAQRMLGYSSLHMLGRPLLATLEPTLTPDEILRVLSQIGEEGVLSREAWQRHEDGRVLLTATNHALLRDEVGNAVGIIGVCRDITGQRAQEDALRCSEERFRSVVSTMSEGVILFGPTGQLELCNPAACTFLGFASEADAVLKSAQVPPLPLVNEAGQPLPREDYPVERALRTGLPVLGKVVGVVKPTGVRWVSLTVQPLPPNGGGPLQGAVMTAIDITDFKRQAARLAASQRQLSAVLEGSEDGFLDWDLAAGTAVVSERAAQMLEEQPQVLLDAHGPWRKRIHPEDDARVVAAVQAHLHGDSAILDEEVRVTTGRGAFGQVRIRGKVVERNAAGEPVRLSGTLRDVTVDCAAQKAVRAAAEQNRLLVEQLQEALKNVRTLSGLVPICAWCKKIRDDGGFWQGVEAYVTAHTQATFSHGMCPECEDRMAREGTIS